MQAGIFRRTMILAILGGMAMGALAALKDGGDLGVGVILGGVLGFPLGIVAGAVLSFVGGRLLVPYRPSAGPALVVRLIASAIVLCYLWMWVLFLFALGQSEGGATPNDHPSLGTMPVIATSAAAILSPWTIRWYLKLVDPSLNPGWASRAVSRIRRRSPHFRDTATSQLPGGE